MNIGVTGGLGFIGHELVKRLIRDNHSVTCVDHWETLIPRYERLKLPIMEEIYGTIPKCVALMNPREFLESSSCWDDRIDSLDRVVHLGAISDTMDLGESGDLFRENVLYTKELARIAGEARIGIVFASSAAVYGSSFQPNNPYGLTKAMGENIMRSCMSPTISLRFFNVFGLNEHHKGRMASVPWKLYNAYMKGNIFEMHSLDASRDFVSVDTVVDAIIDSLGQLSKRIPSHTVLDVGSGHATTFAGIDELISSALGTNSCIKSVEMPAALKGRYQNFTQAGSKGVPNYGTSRSTKSEIMRIYGRGKS